MEICLSDIFFFAIFFLISLCLGYWLLCVFKMKTWFFVFCVLSATLGHFLGGISQWMFSSPDSLFYFDRASPNWGGLGSGVIENILWYLKSWFFGNSFFAMYSFFSWVGTMGSLFYLVCFYQLILKLIKELYLCVNFRLVKWGCFLIACWPSSLFWESAVGKDSIVFFATALFFLTLVLISNRRFSAILFVVITVVLSFLIRPYLSFIIFAGYCGWGLFGRKRKENLLLQILLGAIVFVAFVSVLDIVNKWCNITDLSYESLSQKALLQQNYSLIGSHIFIPAHGSYLWIIFLPYLMAANLFLPLFFWIRNISGIIASLQNVVLIIFCCKFLRHWSIFKKISVVPVVGYMFWYFIAGLTFLGATNANLGLADREKLMYLLPFLVVMFLTFSVKSITNKNKINVDTKCVELQE